MDPVSLFCVVCNKPSLKVTSRSWGPTGTSSEVECEGCKSVGKISNQEPWRGYELSDEALFRIFDNNGIKILAKQKLQNQYWGALENVYPWWFVKTDYGWIEIGWRKRVISIDWRNTTIRTIVTTENVTKEPYMVHAYGIESAVNYMREWLKEAKATYAGVTSIPS